MSVGARHLTICLFYLFAVTCLPTTSHATPIPPDLSRANFQARYKSEILRFLSKPFHQSFLQKSKTTITNGHINPAGMTQGQMHISINQMNISGKNYYVFREDIRNHVTNVSFLKVFETAPPHQLVYYVEKQTAKKHIRVFSIKKEGAVFKASIFFNGRSQKRIMNSLDYNLFDAAGPTFWSSLGPAKGHKLSVNFLISAPNVVALTPSMLFRVTKTFQDIPGRSAKTEITRSWSRGRFSFSMTDTFDKNGQIVFRKLPDSDRRNKFSSFHAIKSDFRQPVRLPIQKFLLPAELPVTPKGFDSAYTATLRIISPKRYGTASLVSNDGYIITAKHNLPRDRYGMLDISHTTIMEFVGHGKLKLAYVPADLDFVILKFEFSPSSPLYLQKLACIPVAHKSYKAGSRFWGIGQSKRYREGSNPYFSDGFHKYTVIGSLLTPEAETSNFPGIPALPKNTGPYYHRYAFSFAGTKGMSGGPVIDRNGQMVAIMTFLRQYAFPDVGNIYSGMRMHGMAMPGILQTIKNEVNQVEADSFFSCSSNGVKVPSNKKRIKRLPHISFYLLKTLDQHPIRMLAKFFHHLADQKTAGLTKEWSHLGQTVGNLSPKIQTQVMSRMWKMFGLHVSAKAGIRTVGLFPDYESYPGTNTNFFKTNVQKALRDYAYAVVKKNPVAKSLNKEQLRTILKIADRFFRK